MTRRLPRIARPGPLTMAVVLLAAHARAGESLPLQAMTVFGQRIVYYDVGRGPVVVLLHGAGSTAERDWGACIPELARRHRVLAPDQLGFGASDKPMIDYGIQTWVDMLGEFLRETKVTDFTLVGESLGGWVAAQYAAQALAAEPGAGPPSVLPTPRRLILSDAAGHRHLVLHVGEPGAGSVTSLAGSRALLGAIFVDPLRASDAAARSQFALNLAKGDGWTLHSLFTNHAIVAEAIDDKLASLTLPTLVVWGAEDHLVPLDDGKDFAARIPGARLVIIPHSGHAPEIEHPDLYLAAVEPFLDRP